MVHQHICDSFGNFTTDCNKSIIQPVESKFDNCKYLFDHENFCRLSNNYKLNQNVDDDSVATTVEISDDSSNYSQDEEMKQEIEDDHWDTTRGAVNVSPQSTSQPSISVLDLK